LNDVLSKALAAWVQEVTGREPVYASEKKIGPRGSRPLAEMMVTGIPVGRHETIVSPMVDDDGVPLPVEPKVEDMQEVATVFSQLMVSMNLIGGDGSREDMTRLRASLGTTKWRDHLAAGGLAFASVSPDRDLSDIVKNEPEPRIQADWFFNIATSYSEALFSIEEITITNQIRGSSVQVEV
jgi:hypothetical protein